MPFYIPNIGQLNDKCGLISLEECSDGNFRVGENGVQSITTTGDRKIEFIAFDNYTLAYVKSAVGYPAYYPIHPVKIKRPIKAVLMDLDGTSVKSEEFWIQIIEMTTASLLNNPNFKLDESDFPYVSGHSVSEHLKYCIDKYCSEKSLEEARSYYFKHTQREMKAIIKGDGKKDAFTPTSGLKDFLLEIKSMGIKIALVTSGLYEKAWPEIYSAFCKLGLGDPKDFYDAIITAGFPLQKGKVGTLGELSPKPHPWLYAEVCRVGLGIPFKQRNSIIGIEDSAAGIASIRLAGFTAIGIKGGNILTSGMKPFCNYYCNNFKEILKIIKGGE